MACTYDITTDRGKVRLIINDTASPTGCIFSDLEIDTFLAMHAGSVNLAAAEALGAWAAKYTLLPDSEKIGDYAYTQKIIANMNKLKTELEDKEAKAPILEISEPDLSGLGDTTVGEDLE
ncbi:unnamed protein product [marine sediment metagenome]|uniref:Uncharacterized protein n=1 Tax=marine sediment metagenome TaxID=412755 RepID=X1CRQ4_9ZZZZ